MRTSGRLADGPGDRGLYGDGPVAHDSPLRALRAAPGHTLFEYMAEAPLADAGEADPDLVILANAHPGRLEKSIQRAREMLPDRIWDALRASRAFLVLDASTEGAEAEAGVVEPLHGFLAETGVAAERAIYVTQDRLFEADYARRCAAQGTRPAFSVLVFDYWQRALLDSFAGRGRKIHDRRLERYRARAPRRSRRFLSLNLTLRPSKLAFLTSILKDGLWDAGHISVGSFDQQAAKGKGAEARREGFLEDPSFGPLARQLRPELDRLEALGEILLGDGSGSRTRDGRPKFTDDAQLPEYDDCWFSVVTETEMRRVASRITEKPFKPIANFHPFLVLGNPGALDLLRRLGFQTFEGLFDEAYDQEPDPRRRFDMVYGQVLALCRCDEAELARRAQAASEAVEFNAAHLLTRLPVSCREEIDRPFMKQLRDLMARAG